MRQDEGVPILVSQEAPGPSLFLDVEATGQAPRLGRSSDQPDPPDVDLARL
jgi:hypothetical protein